MHSRLSNAILIFCVISMIGELVFFILSGHLDVFREALLMGWFATNCFLLMGGVIIRFMD